MYFADDIGAPRRFKLPPDPATPPQEMVRTRIPREAQRANAAARADQGAAAPGNPAARLAGAPATPFGDAGGRGRPLAGPYAGGGRGDHSKGKGRDAATTPSKGKGNSVGAITYARRNVNLRRVSRCLAVGRHRSRSTLLAEAI